MRPAAPTWRSRTSIQHRAPERRMPSPPDRWRTGSRMTAPHVSLPGDPTHLPQLPRLPPTDPLLPPLTGWPRAHWEAVADRLLDGLLPYATPGFAQYRLP